MPFDSPEKKKRWQEKWKKQGKEIGYNKWLYDRRKLRYDDALAFREALERIAGGEFHPQNIAKAYLKASHQREQKVGPSPRANGVPVPTETNGGPPQEEKVVKSDSLFEAVAKLGLK